MAKGRFSLARRERESGLLLWIFTDDGWELKGPGSDGLHGQGYKFKNKVLYILAMVTTKLAPNCSLYQNASKEHIFAGRYHIHAGQGRRLLFGHRSTRHECPNTTSC